jgi:hypothetical protein
MLLAHSPLYGDTDLRDTGAGGRLDRLLSMALPDPGTPRIATHDGGRR